MTLPLSILDPRSYHGFARAVIYPALLFAHWPLVLLVIYAEGYGFRGVWIRWLQELAILRGMSETEARERHRI